ncbi:MAG TPA: DUF445 family protein [Blastocatellia bacterium]|nr:DUF445 family protein [Blastocatellia bacterium]
MNLELLIKLSPLVVATLHGYGAAWLAVKMLFRPRHPVYLFGWQLPLTPGMLPKEREHFIEALSTVIAERLLDIETIADELMKLDLHGEITTLAQREYLHHSQSESTIQAITEHLRERLYHLRDSVESRWEITRALRKVIEQEMEQRFSVLRRMVTNYFLDDEALYRIVGDSINKLADQIVDSLYVRTTISQAMAQVPERLLSSGAMVQSATVSTFVRTLSQRLDFRAILIKRLSALSNEDIEQLIMETAGREISAIVWFGAGIGFVVGIVQTLINFL